jgi:transcriptional regulator with XRE-family HTH domain
MERKEEILRKFGKQLTTIRKQKGLSIRELALATHLETGHIQKIEAGKVNLLLSTILSLARGLEIAPEELLKPL